MNELIYELLPSSFEAVRYIGNCAYDAQLDLWLIWLSYRDGCLYTADDIYLYTVDDIYVTYRIDCVPRQHRIMYRM